MSNTSHVQTDVAETPKWQEEAAIPKISSCF